MGDLFRMGMGMGIPKQKTMGITQTLGMGIGILKLRYRQPGVSVWLAIADGGIPATVGEW